MKYDSYIGKCVEKESGKPFKSKQKINTIKDLIVHPVTNREAFTFYEDDSFVECRMLKLI